MFDIGLPEFFVLALLGLIIFGPDRLPTMAAQLARFINRLKAQASAATAELGDGIDTATIAQVATDLKKFTPMGMVASTVANVAGGSQSRSSAASRPAPQLNVTFDPDAT